MFTPNWPKIEKCHFDFSEWTDTIEKLSEYNLSRGDIAFLHNVRVELLESFVSGLSRVAKRSRVVVIVDGFEKIPHLEDWFLTDLIPTLGKNNTIVVVSSRRSLSGSWSTLASVSNTIHLKPFTTKGVKTYINKRGLKINRTVLRRVMRFTEGLPLAVALWCETPDVLSKSGSAANFMEERIALVTLRIEDYLTSQFTDENLKNALLICSAVRHFDEDSLAFLLNVRPVDAKAIFSVLRQYPGVFKLHPYGLAVHEVLRHHLVASFRIKNLPEFSRINEIALAYYEQKTQDSLWAMKGTYVLDYAYHVAILEDQKDILDLFFNEYDAHHLRVTSVEFEDLPQILAVDWKAFPNEANRISMSRLSDWFAASPESFRVAKDDSDQIVGYSCILKLKPSSANAIIDGSLSFKQIDKSCLLLNPQSIDTSRGLDYMMDSLAIADLNRPEIGAVLLRDMFTQIRGTVRLLLSVAVTKYGADILKRSGFNLVRTLPETVDGFNYEVYVLDLNEQGSNSLIRRILRKLTIPGNPTISNK